MPATNLAQMNAAEITIRTMAANGLDTLYCLPGVQNDDFFDALVRAVGSSRVDLQACKLEYSIVSPK